MIRHCYQGASAQRDRRVFIAAACPDIAFFPPNKPTELWTFSGQKRAGKEGSGTQRGDMGLVVISDWASSLGIVNVSDWASSLEIMNTAIGHRCWKEKPSVADRYH